MRTAMQELKDTLMESGQLTDKLDDYIDELLIKEREAIMNAFVAGSERGTKDTPFNCEQYFTQTYKTP